MFTRFFKGMFSLEDSRKITVVIRQVVFLLLLLFSRQ